MYKIYINNNPLFLVEEASKKQFEDNHTSILKYQKKHIPMIVDQMEKNVRYQRKVLYSEDLKTMKKEFIKYFKRIDASGGVVINQNHDILLIFRHGTWDLPKGKIEKKEKKKVAAIREVQEETGLNTLNINTKITSTYHCYRLENKTRILKKTHWYLMYTPETKVEPQLEEGITAVNWSKPQDIMCLHYPKYSNVREVINNAFRIINY